MVAKAADLEKKYWDTTGILIKFIYHVLCIFFC